MKKKSGLILAAVFSLTAFPVSAATFSYSGSFVDGECVGQGGFDNCMVAGSPTVARIRYKKGFQVHTRVNNTVFPSIDGSEFAISLTNRRKGNWGFTPGDGDPINITAFVVKAKGKYAVYTWDSDSDSDFSNIFWSTRGLGKNIKLRRKSMKYITFFDTGAASRETANLSPVPLPAAGFFLIAGLGGLMGLRRRRKS